MSNKFVLNIFFVIILGLGIIICYQYNNINNLNDKYAERNKEYKEISEYCNKLVYIAEEQDALEEEENY